MSDWAGCAGLVSTSNGCKNSAGVKVAPGKTNTTKFLAQMFAFSQAPFNLDDSNISKIAAPVLIVSCDNAGFDKIELIKTYRLVGGNVSADLAPTPKSQFAIVPSRDMSA